MIAHYILGKKIFSYQFFSKNGELTAYHDQKLTNELEEKRWRNKLILQKQINFVYQRQQNKCYPQRCLLAHFKAILDFSRSEFTCP